MDDPRILYTPGKYGRLVKCEVCGDFYIERREKLAKDCPRLCPIHSGETSMRQQMIEDGIMRPNWMSEEEYKRMRLSQLKNQNKKGK